MRFKTPLRRPDVMGYNPGRASATDSPVVSAITNPVARILHELPELSVDFTSAAWLIVCRSMVIAMVQAGSADMCREIRRQTGSGTLCVS